MEYHRLKPRFDTANYDPKRISFIYVLSQHEGKGPYKVGMSKGDLWRRMGNYQTVFVSFFVHYLVPVPGAGGGARLAGGRGVHAHRTPCAVGFISDGLATGPAPLGVRGDLPLGP